MQIIPKCVQLHLLKAEGLVLSVKSNRKINACLKELVDFSGIAKNLSYHIARHTFATTFTMMNGLPIESVSKMLGHKNLRTTQHYAKVLDRKVSEDMKILKDKFFNNNKLSKTS